jgi:nucleotide-binding universal stress UspA family protein
LVAYNGSRTATAAIDVAADWIQAWSAETWVLYVRPWDRTRGSGRFFLETRSEARALAQTGVNRLCTKGVTATALVHDACRQRVAEAIVAQAEALGASCIVLGTHARGILSLAVLGSTSHAVLRKANRPVVLVKARDDRRLAADIGFD